MNQEQREYIYRLQAASPEEIFIKRTGWEDVNLSVHSHPMHQVVYTLSGTLHVQMRGTNYFVPEKHIAWIPKGEAHELCSKNRQVSLVIYYIDWSVADGWHTSYQDFSIYMTNPVIAENLKFIASTGDIISRKEKPELYDFALAFLRLLPSMPPVGEVLLKTRVIPDDMRLHPILDYMMAHLTDGLRIEQVALEFGFSVRNLSRLLHASGIRFSDYMNHQRIVRAIELYSDGGRTMQQVAYEVGFSTPNHFNRVFKQVTGMAPTLFFNSKK